MGKVLFIPRQPVSVYIQYKLSTLRNRNSFVQWIGLIRYQLRNYFNQVKTNQMTRRSLLFAVL